MSTPKAGTATPRGYGTYRPGTPANLIVRFRDPNQPLPPRLLGASPRGYGIDEAGRAR